MIVLARRPTAVSAATASRSMSPVDRCEIPYLALIRSAWVPFPAPGGPSKTSFISASRRADGIS